MPSRLKKKRAQNKKYYKEHKEKLSLQARENYAANRDAKKSASNKYFEAHKEQRLNYHSNYHEAHRDERNASFHAYYDDHEEERKACFIKYYTANKEKMKAYFCKYYDSHREQRKASFNEYYAAHKDEMKVSFGEYYEAHKDEMKVSFGEYYEAHKDEMKVSFSEYYEAHKDEMKVSFSEYYDAHKDEMKVYFGEYYDTHKDEIKGHFREYYTANMQEMKTAFKSHYMKHKQAILKARALYYAKYRNKAIAASRVWNAKNAKSAVRRAQKRYYAKHRAQYCAGMRQRYDLAEPKLYIQHQYVTEVCRSVLCNKKVVSLLEKAFTEKYESVASDMTRATCKRAIASIAAKRLVNRVLRLRKHYAGSLLRSIRSITKIVIAEKGDIGEGLHSAHSEPFFYESAYHHYVDRPDSMSIDECGRYRPECEVSEQEGDSIPRTWKCSSKCKQLTDKEIGVILDFKSGFGADMKDVRKLLDKCDDDCPNTHYQKVVHFHDQCPNGEIVHYNSVELKGHSLLCFTGDECNSKLRILRAASTHYAVLRSFLHAVYDAIRNHKRVAHLDAALHSGDFTYLMRACEIDSYESLLSNEVQSTHQLSVYELDSPLRKPNLEYELQTTHARIMALYDKDVHDYYKHPCCSCCMLFNTYQTSVTKS